MGLTPSLLPPSLLPEDCCCVLVRFQNFVQGHSPRGGSLKWLKSHSALVEGGELSLAAKETPPSGAVLLPEKDFEWGVPEHLTL